MIRLPNNYHLTTDGRIERRRGRNKYNARKTTVDGIEKEKSKAASPSDLGRIIDKMRESDV